MIFLEYFLRTFMHFLFLVFSWAHNKEEINGTTLELILEPLKK